MQDQPVILIVDDEEVSRDLLKALLRRQDYQFISATDGKNALSILDQIMPDVILLDVMMPDMDGFQVCRTLKNTPKWKHIPIILITALTGKDDLARGIEAGADDFLNKPVNGLELRARVKSMLRIRKQYDDLQESLRLREDLAGMIVHDMRTPLSSIVGFSQLLLSLSLVPSEKGKDYVKTIQTQAMRINGFLTDMLFMAKIEQGHPVLNPSPTTIQQIVETVLPSHQMIANSRQITLHAETPAEPIAIVVDVNLFQRVVDNLLSNALKFSPPESAVLVRVETQPGDSHFLLQVIDEGPGIPEQDQARIFNRYEIADTKQKNIPQIGLGLAFCKMVVEAHQGQIEVANNHPNGSIFTVKI